MFCKESKIFPAKRCNFFLFSTLCLTSDLMEIKQTATTQTFSTFKRYQSKHPKHLTFLLRNYRGLSAGRESYRHRWTMPKLLLEMQHKPGKGHRHDSVWADRAEAFFFPQCSGGFFTWMGLLVRLRPHPREFGYCCPGAPWKLFVLLSILPCAASAEGRVQGTHTIRVSKIFWQPLGNFSSKDFQSPE